MSFMSASLGVVLSASVVFAVFAFRLRKHSKGTALLSLAAGLFANSGFAYLVGTVALEGAEREVHACIAAECGVLGRREAEEPLWKEESEWSACNAAEQEAARSRCGGDTLTLVAPDGLAIVSLCLLLISYAVSFFIGHILRKA